jgi:hypothetical protein
MLSIYHFRVFYIKGDCISLTFSAGRDSWKLVIAVDYVNGLRGGIGQNPFAVACIRAVVSAAVWRNTVAEEKLLVNYIGYAGILVELV